ncbi:transporter substrate-binding domain-containing protein [Geobacter sp.]|uniref:transporter substrate-binding domain-containing protein n=1 Tax=Geobacter sp. TaxID=46610 RepID=UPI0027BAEFDD|nr:transporter substrate-binding domain-containing protein [Geobacter sp.]
MALLMVNALLAVGTQRAWGRDLDEVRRNGVLRHLGIPYAYFVTGSGDGMDVELVQLFAASLGVRYEFVKTSWNAAIADLTEKQRGNGNDAAQHSGGGEYRGDIIATGMTVLPWRERAVAFSEPLFPTQVWVIARADSPVRPIRPSGSLSRDIGRVKKLLRGRTLFCAPGSCLDPALYGIEETGAVISIPKVGAPDELAPAIIKGEAEMSLLDVPDVLVALQKWPGKIKVIGPISGVQEMSAAFRKESPLLRAAFNRFLEQCRKDGTYDRLVRKYYPFAPGYFPEFFHGAGKKDSQGRAR